MAESSQSHRPGPDASPPSVRSLVAGDGTSALAGGELATVEGRGWLEAMWTLRFASQKLTELQAEGEIAVHASCAGEEAAMVGAVLAADASDWIFPSSRDSCVAVLRGLSLADWVHHAFGSPRGPFAGRLMPEHLGTRAGRVVVPSGLTGAHLTHAVGFAWASRMRRERHAVLVTFGDGATSTGEFHNALNFAGVFRAPVVFLCRNNGRASSVPVHRQTLTETMAEKAVAYGIEAALCDGNDVAAVHDTVRAALDRARRGGGPTLVEATTSPLDDSEASIARDPIVRLRAVLRERGLWSDELERALLERLDAQLAAAVEEARSAPRPGVEGLVDHVYAVAPPMLIEQVQAASRLER